MSLMNERTHEQVATSVEIAATRRSRRRGLLGRDSLDEAFAMLLAPCAAVHTAGMRFPIDVVFVDRQGYAVEGRPRSAALAHLARGRGARRHRDAGRQPALGAGAARRSPLSHADSRRDVARFTARTVNP